ncbi:MAG: 5'-deoxynucleotidase [Deltaproteobacteria bacterium]|nr:5'-deoxynucleotidase [Deltaproteobacteria bacterium]
MSHFFAYLSRMKLIQRWPLMQNIRPENVQEHSLQVAIVAHALAVIGNRYFGGDVNPERVAVLAMFHDASEVFTGDMPTPVKYFSQEIRDAYKKMELEACSKLLSYLPDDLQAEYNALIHPQKTDDKAWRVVKAADTLSAYLKCLEELSVGNLEFNRAKLTIEEKLRAFKMKEVDYFLRHFAPSFSLTLDELGV